jgi:hypothetical protein
MSDAETPLLKAKTFWVQPGGSGKDRLTFDIVNVAIR